MNILQAFFVLMAFIGACALAFFVGEFLELHFKHRRQRRNRRWPREQHRSFFTDCKRMFDDDY